jgi:hypothetical protein
MHSNHPHSEFNGNSFFLYAERCVKDLMDMSPVEDLEAKRMELDLSTAVASLTILRYLTDHMSQLPMGLIGRLLSTNDTIMALIPLLDNPPWVRQNRGKVCRLNSLVGSAVQLLTVYCY